MAVEKPRIDLSTSEFEQLNSNTNLVHIIKIAKDSGIAGFGILFYVITAYGINFVISRFLGAEGVGIYAQAMTIVLFIPLPLQATIGVPLP